ncbi:MAG: DinB family protein [Phycisphaerales bacterium]|nr:DinB family protein [Phycisphaerales bacterium]
MSVAASEVLASLLENSLGTVKATLADFTDEQMLTRPSPKSHHPMWVILHLTMAEHRFIGAHNPNMPPVPADLAAHYHKGKTLENATLADYPGGKKAVLGAFEATRKATIAWVRSLTPEQLEQPSKELAQMFPKLHNLIGMQVLHTMMHIGQCQVVRRVLDKPVLM